MTGAESDCVAVLVVQSICFKNSDSLQQEVFRIILCKRMSLILSLSKFHPFMEQDGNRIDVLQDPTILAMSSCGVRRIDRPSVRPSVSDPPSVRDRPSVSQQSMIYC